jgi:hypothetical protein
MRSGGRGYSAVEGHAMVQRVGDIAQFGDRVAMAEDTMNWGWI